MGDKCESQVDSSELYLDAALQHHKHHTYYLICVFKRLQILQLYN